MNGNNVRKKGELLQHYIIVSEIQIISFFNIVGFHQDSPDKKIDDKNKKEERKKEKSPKKLDSKGEITKS